MTAKVPHITLSNSIHYSKKKKKSPILYAHFRPRLFVFIRVTSGRRLHASSSLIPSRRQWLYLSDFSPRKSKLEIWEHTVVVGKILRKRLTVHSALLMISLSTKMSYPFFFFFNEIYLVDDKFNPTRRDETKLVFILHPKTSSCHAALNVWTY